MEMVKEDPDESVRHFAKMALIHIGLPSLPALMEAMKDENYLFRYQVVDALAWMHHPEVVPLLKEALLDEDIWVRRRAAEALSEKGENWEKSPDGI